MPRYSLKSVALFVIAFCVFWQSAGVCLSTAHAGCGDYVHLGGMESLKKFTGNSTGKFTGIANGLFGLESRGPDQGLPRRSCHGPHCRQQPLTPTAPTPVTNTSIPQRKACLIEQTVPVLPVSHKLILEVAAPHGELPESRIDRPPKSCS